MDRAVDQEYGGFLVDFDDRWHPVGPRASPAGGDRAERWRRPAGRGHGWKDALHEVGAFIALSQ